MTIGDVIKGLEKLPKLPEFDWTGPEQYHQDVVKTETSTAEGLRGYVLKLRERTTEQSMAIDALIEYVKALNEWLRDLEIESAVKKAE